MIPSTDTDDGLLTATNIANLKLDADLIILSACNTAAPRDVNRAAHRVICLPALITATISIFEKIDRKVRYCDR
jgi:hypothetical protein